MKLFDIKNALNKISELSSKRTSIESSMKTILDQDVCIVNGIEMVDDVCKRRFYLAIKDYHQSVDDKIAILKRSIGVDVKGGVP